MRFYHKLIYKMARDQGGRFLLSDLTENTCLHHVLVSLALSDLCVWGLVKRVDSKEFIVI